MISVLVLLIGLQSLSLTSCSSNSRPGSKKEQISIGMNIATRDLGARFNRLLSMVPSSAAVIADVGCDHGLLSARLATYPHVQRVLATDISPHAAAGAKALFESLNNNNNNNNDDNLMLSESKICLSIGDGLEPVVKVVEREEIECDTVILSGMGVRSLFHILCTTDDTNDADDVISRDTTSDTSDNVTLRRSVVVDSERKRKRIENKNKNRNKHEKSNGIKQSEYVRTHIYVRVGIAHMTHIRLSSHIRSGGIYVNRRVVIIVCCSPL